MSAAEDHKPALHCAHCGREVAETTHTRTAYRVDYYSLHTGDVEPVTMARPDDPSEAVTVLRLVQATNVVSCADCYRQPQVQRAREVRFRPELAAAEQDASSLVGSED